MNRNNLVRNTLFIFSIMICCQLNAQNRRDSIPPLFRFLQDNFDTTIIWSIESSWFSTELPRFDIISIKDGKTYFFQYKNPYPHIGWTKSLSPLFSRENLKYTSVTIDTNQYFFPIAINPQLSTQIKNGIDTLSIWSIRDDVLDGEGCAECQCSISDAGTNIFYLIDSSIIKKLSFYGLDYYTQHCKPRDGRQRITQVINIYKKTFYPSQ